MRSLRRSHGTREPRVVTGRGFAKARLARMHEVKLGHVASGDLPGVVYAMHGGEAHVAAVGAKVFGTNDAMGPDTLFRIASLSKSIAAVAALTLVEDQRSNCCRLTISRSNKRKFPLSF